MEAERSLAGSARKPALLAECRRTIAVGNHDGGLQLRKGCFWGAQTGPNPTDRGKAGSKHHLITDGEGTPLAVEVTAANRHDVTMLLPLVDAVPAIGGRVGRPRRRPARVLADKGYDSNRHREALKTRGIRPEIPRRGVTEPLPLGGERWVVERTVAWLRNHRRLKVRYERREDIHHAFLVLACICITENAIRRFC